MTQPFRYAYRPLTGDSGRIAATVSVPSDSDWFSGHFPGNPIVPGVALLAFVKKAVLEAEWIQGRRIEITGVRRVRFRLPVNPDDVVQLEVMREAKPGGLSYVFNVCLGGEVACSGVLAATVAPSS